jgi:hypothetical protein
MGIVLKAAYLLLILMPDFNLKWLAQEQKGSFAASLNGYDSELNACVASGLSLRMKYEFRICKNRKLWFDDCGKIRVAFSSLEFDPISETYLITKDFLGDVELPYSERTEVLSRAITSVSHISKIDLDWIEENASAALQQSRTGLRGRVIVECRGDYSESVKRLSTFLSLGFIETSEFDSEWVKFSD